MIFPLLHLFNIICLNFNDITHTHLLIFYLLCPGLDRSQKKKFFNINNWLYSVCVYVCMYVRLNQ